MNPETAALLDQLTGQRRHVLGILDGLDDTALRQPVLPSGWTCLGLVQHLALDVERFWFRAVIAGQPTDQPGNTWHTPDGTPAGDILDLYRHETARADAILAATPPDNPPAAWPGELFGDWKLGTVREIVLHVLTETACHAGHLDAARELIDRRQWMVAG